MKKYEPVTDEPRIKVLSESWGCSDTYEPVLVGMDSFTTKEEAAAQVEVIANAIADRVHGEELAELRAKADGLSKLVVDACMILSCGGGSLLLRIEKEVAWRKEDAKTIASLRSEIERTSVRMANLEHELDEDEDEDDQSDRVINIQCSCATKTVEHEPDPSCEDCKGTAHYQQDPKKGRCACAIRLETCNPDPDCLQCDGEGLLVGRLIRPS